MLRAALMRLSWAVAASILVLTGEIGQAQAQATLDARLQAALQTAGPRDRIPVVIKHRDRSAIESLPTPVSPLGAQDRKERKRDIPRLLRERSATVLTEVEDDIRRKGGDRVKRLWILNGAAARLTPPAIEQLRRRSDILEIQYDAVVANAPAAAPQTVIAEWNINTIQAPSVWGLGFTGQNVVVGVMDTGVDLHHSDLVGRYRGGANSWFDPYGQHATPNDVHGHGTSMASVIVGGNAGGTSIGVAPGARWIAARIFNNLSQATLSAIHQSFQWFLDPDGNPATGDAPDIVNASWGLNATVNLCNTEFAGDIQALRSAGITVVFSAGNSGPNSASSLSPANNPGAFSVGAIDIANGIASFSSRGPSPCNGVQFPRVVTPGVSIYSADLTFGGVFPNSYVSVTGTSPSAAHVSGVMALLLSAFPQTAVTDLESAVATTALDLGAVGTDPVMGAGKIDALAAYNQLLATQPPPPPPPPVNTIALSSVTYDARRRVMTVIVTSAKADQAALTLNGYGPMSWIQSLQVWSRSARVTPLPATVTISGPEGTSTFSTGG
jgi:serine protease AprX